MEKLNPGDKAPDFTLPTDGGGSISLKKLKGQKVVLYFYPKDDTSGCTKEAIAFNGLKAKFSKANTEIIGVSADSPQSHDKFKAKYDLNFTLASDEKKGMLEAYGVWVEKSMYGKKYFGTERTTFVIGPDQKIAAVLPKVKPEQHLADVLAALP